MLVRILMLMLSLTVSIAEAQDKVKLVFKRPSVMAQSMDMKRMTFGLTDSQISKIRDLTSGRVDMGNVYYQEVGASEASLMSRSSDFSGIIYPNVPPPVQPKAEPSQIVNWGGDPELKGQWWIDDLKVPDTWNLATGDGVTIADCDAGFYHQESDLQDNMLLEFAYDLANKEEPGVVNDGPYAYHGTAVTAIIAGVKDNAGTNGIAYNAKIVPLQNYNYDEKDDLDKEEATAACILRAINTPKVNVIVLENQMANGSSEAFVGTRDAVRLAMQAGITVVGAGGNYSKELTEEKKDNTGSIIVGALARDSKAAYFTNFGERLTVGAFGEQLHTLYGPNGQFGEFGGTSGATPQVAATVALMKEVNPFLTPVQAHDFLVATRTMTSDNAKAGGKLNVFDAVQMAKDTAPDIASWSEQEIFRAQLRQILSQ